MKSVGEASEASEAADINSEVCQQFRLLRNSRFFFSFKISLFSKISDFFFPLLSEGEMKIHHKTKRGLNTLKFGGYSEILTLILRGKWKSRE